MADYEEILAEGFIKDNSNLMISKIPVLNRPFCVANVETMLSTCCYNIHTGSSAGTLPLTTWILGILGSGDWKSVPVKGWTLPIIRFVEKMVGSNIRLIISKFSDESLIRHLTWHQIESYNEKTEKIEKKYVIGNVGVIICDEYTSMVKGIKHKDYMSGSLELLSEVYDGTIPLRDTIKHGEQRVTHCAKSFLAATTPYLYTFPIEDQCLQGGMNRIDISNRPDDEYDEELPSDYLHQNQINKNKDVMAKIAENLVKLIQPPLRVVTPDEEADDKWHKYELECRQKKRSYGVLDPMRGYVARQAEKVLKRTALYTVSRFFNNIITACPKILVSEIQDIEQAIKTQEFYLKNFQQMLIDYKRKRKGYGRMKSDKEILEKTLAIITEYKVISKQKLAAELEVNDTNDELHSTVKTLENNGDIECIYGNASRMLIANAGKKWLFNQKVKKPRDTPPVFYKLVGVDTFEFTHCV